MTIFNLQILRGLAALGVVFYHTGFPLPGIPTAWTALSDMTGR
jgi:peptidoglycan/LPS O-acetylase OafA/YrhL